MKQCKSCIHWHPKQRELNYSQFTGFCLSPYLKFSTIDGRSVALVDRNENITNEGVAQGDPSLEFESLETCVRVKRSNYSLVTNEGFGCINHEPIKPSR